VCKINKRGAGVVFCFISAFLFATRYISAAIFGSNNVSRSQEVFTNMLKYTGYTLIFLSMVSLIVGIRYLVLAEKEK